MTKKLLTQLIAVGSLALIVGGTSLVVGLTNPDNTLKPGENEQGEVTPTDPEEVYLAKLEVSKKPNKIIYHAGEKFDPTGMELKATYSDGTTETITEGYTVEFVTGESIDEDLDKSMSQIKITWEGKNAYMTGIVVRDKLIIGDKYRFEAENSHLTSVGTTNWNCNYLSMTDNASEGRCVNIRKGISDTTIPDGYKMSWTINCDSNEDEVECQLFIRVAMRAKWIDKIGSKYPLGQGNKMWVPYQKYFDEMYDVSLNTDNVPFSNLLSAYGISQTVSNSHISFNEFNWRTVSTNITLKKGSNVLTLSTLGNGKSTGPVDFIDIISPSALINVTENQIAHTVDVSDNTWEVVKDPTLDTVGYLGKKCSVCGSVQAMVKLPKLNPSDYTDCEVLTAATATRDGVGNYKFSKDGQDFYFNNQPIPATEAHNVYRYEAEDAHLEGVSTKGDELSHLYNTCYDGDGIIDASDQGYVGNFGAVGNKLSYTLSSNKAAQARISFRFSAVKGESSNFSNQYTVTNNGTPIFTEDMAVPAGATELSNKSAAGFDWYTITRYVDLVEGDNNIVFTLPEAHDQHIDYMEINTVATLTNKTASLEHHMCYFPAIIPNFEKGGLLVWGCDKCLKNRTCNENVTEFIIIPSLNRSDYGYEIVEVDGVKYERYTYYLNEGESVYFDSKY